jgi:LemA protein
MKKGSLILIGLIALFGVYSCNSYNGLVGKDNLVQKAWSEVQNQYQRRADLIGNLVKTVQGAADFEKSTLTDVIAARASATQIKLDANDLTPENMAKFEAAQSQLNGALSRLMMVAEQYPQLQANKNFLDLQAQLEGTENRISVARRDFNEATADYNLAVRTFPANIMAGIFGFAQKELFKATEAAQTAPDINFDFDKK